MKPATNERLSADGWRLLFELAMNNAEKLIGVLGCTMAVVSAYLILREAWATALNRNHRPEFMFSPSIVAIGLAILALMLDHRRGKLRTGLWFALPAIMISAAAIIFAIAVRNSPQ